MNKFHNHYFETFTTGGIYPSVSAENQTAVMAVGHVTRNCYRTNERRASDVRLIMCFLCCLVRRRQNRIPNPHTTTAVDSTTTDWSSEASPPSTTNCTESSSTTPSSSHRRTPSGDGRIPRGRMSGLRTIDWMMSTSSPPSNSRCAWKRSL